MGQWKGFRLRERGVWKLVGQTGTGGPVGSGVLRGPKEGGKDPSYTKTSAPFT